MARYGSCDGKHRVEGLYFLGSSLQLLGRQRLDEMGRRLDGGAFDALVATDAVVERESRRQFLVEQLDIA